MDEYRDSTGNNYMFKIFMVMSFAATMLFFSIIFSLHFMIEKKGGSDCIEQIGTSAVFIYEKTIHTKSMAEKLIEIHVNSDKEEHRIRFLRGGLESCGPVFTFIDRTENVKYAACENGKIYRYVMKCKN